MTIEIKQLKCGCYIVDGKYVGPNYARIAQEEPPIVSGKMEGPNPPAGTSLLRRRKGVKTKNGLHNNRQDHDPSREKDPRSRSDLTEDQRRKSTSGQEVEQETRRVVFNERPKAHGLDGGSGRSSSCSLRRRSRKLED